MRFIVRSMPHFTALAMLASPAFAQDHRVSIVVSGAGLSGNAEALLREHGFNQSASSGSCVFLCSASTKYPHTVGGREALLITIRRRWTPTTGLALTYQRPTSSGRSVGYRSPGYATSIEPHVQMFGITLYREGPSGGRMAAGPALYRVRTVQTLGVGGGRYEATQHRVGALAELGVVWPRRSRVFIDAAVQGRIVPGLRLEPQEIRYFAGGYAEAEQREPWLFPGGTYSLVQAALTVGLGIRL